ncbi:hypothetical protein A2715_05495 [Candidatus Woesebacteria bacterium RIFCSPHIGHO2_01_FULL_39_32]|uniref:Haloacid dehalogenase n=1 Tax=Candidatus Woesebacteria bacterium RIFCSPLOWO2_01_FULL_39_25 TaxID=1802521 RepID=A0A1F8BNS6_9BACT|nr:MAG: hypothetical protein A2124_03940 [Candidatus Woesebacteria bacterium GWB1_37_5]OGM25474.1 MAG: hypothetical protein A2715_05495 [Candidatus Woesebacteria bacterium RIFCSPHIGHO2_01_FULL_39_32]OGM38577.1 MAG: hypothetical protein A3F01_04450 [Candidatus Woesebacteria bacterium RIFCSPHIGHO2_12_FULL_38_11]OGM65005.1 MAG: hypothetical protein A2893_05105 [Candidatus Woesebacteria bacterium RIFCSPLOWO2_01_FULL_39_25]
MNNFKLLNSYKNIIYDFDGTLFKFDLDWKGWHDRVKAFIKEHEPTFEKEGLVNNIQNDYVKKYGKSLRDKICSMNETYEIENIENVLPNTKLIDYIKTRKDVRNFVLTSNNHKLVDGLLKKYGIYDKFEQIIARDDVLLIKPDIEGIQKILNGENLKDFIMVGNSTNDELTAKTSGIAFEMIKI